MPVYQMVCIFHNDQKRDVTIHRMKKQDIAGPNVQQSQDMFIFFLDLSPYYQKWTKNSGSGNLDEDEEHKKSLPQWTACQHRPYDSNT